jgi:hypothetical protein
MEETVCGHEILAVRFLAAEKRPSLKKLDWLQIKHSLEKASPLPCMVHHCHAAVWHVCKR